MALKIWLNRSMQQIDTNLHKPVIFLNGTKYKLDKGYTFINGEKKILWGESGVQIDYISSTGSLGGGNVFAIGENWANVYNNNVIYRLNISNLSNPTLIQNVAWGNVMRFNGYQTSGTTEIFESWHTSNRTANKLSLNTTNGEMLSVDSSTLTATSSSTNTAGLLGMTNNNIVCSFNQLITLRPIAMYDIGFYWNNVQKYTASGTIYSGLTQNTANSVLVMQNGIIYSLTESAKSQIGTDYDVSKDIFYENNLLYYATQNKVNKTASGDILTVLDSYECGANEKLRMIGKIDNFIYLIILPTGTLTSASEVRLRLIDVTDMTVEFERILPNDPFNENSGIPTFWNNCNIVPQYSNSRFLGVSTYNTSTLGLRIARFSGIF